MKANIQQACVQLGGVAFNLERNGWISYYGHVPPRRKWAPKPGSTTYVLPNATGAMRYGCSRHKHACAEARLHQSGLLTRPRTRGRAPCCTEVMAAMMADLTRVMEAHGVIWRVAQGQLCSIARDGCLQQWDHDFDPVFSDEQRARELIAAHMHTAGPMAQWREAHHHYTLRVAAELQTDWTRYKVVGGDFDWARPAFRRRFALQANSFFMDVGQARAAAPTRANTFLCAPNVAVRCPVGWRAELDAHFARHPWRAYPSWLDRAQTQTYGGYTNYTPHQFLA